MNGRGDGEREGRLLLGGLLLPGRVRFRGGRIDLVETYERAETEDASRPGEGALPILAPGLIDLHVHGFGGAEPVGGLEVMSLALARAGTTAFLPTLFPGLLPDMVAAIATVSRTGGSERVHGARALGVHLEGPFVNPAAAGALPARHFLEPSPKALGSLLAGAEGRVRAITLAPELSGAPDLVRELGARGIVASLGHSVATCAEARRAVDAGARAATHLFNAMRPWHHREVGLAGLALTDERLFAELIGDGLHVAREAVELALAARGPGGLSLVSDALPAAGTETEELELPDGARVRRRGGAFYLAAAGEARLAGSATAQLEAVRGLVREGVLSLEEALTMASETPARALAVEGELGRIAEGAWADLILLDPRDLSLREVLVGGLAPG